MSSWAVLLALTGFQCDGVSHRLEFAPRVSSDDFRTFWSTGTGWGIYRDRIKDGRRAIEVQMKYGSLSLKDLVLEAGKARPKTVKASLHGGTVPVSLEMQEGKLLIHFEKPLEISADDVLSLSIR
jgi:hypothetical protein